MRVSAFDDLRNLRPALDVQFVSRVVEVEQKSGLGLEATARQARYDAFRDIVEEGDWLLSAHHEDDQAETLLLNLMRGSGLAGLAGIGELQRFGDGMLARPLLGESGESIKAYAEQHELHWIDDPSNLDTRFDRNFLRREVVPALAKRWPGVVQRLGKSAELASEASALLNDLAQLDLANIATGLKADKLDIDGLKSLSEKRQRNLLRYAVKQCGLPPPPATRLYQATQELIPAREDAQPLVAWPGAEIRRYRDKLYLLAEVPDVDALESGKLTADGDWLDLGVGSGQMRLEAGVDGEIQLCEVVPALAKRWPGVVQRLGKSAELASEASAILNDLAQLDLANIATGLKADKLDIDGLKSLSEKRQRNLLRYAVKQCGLPPPPATRLYQATQELIPAREDAQPLVAWPGAEIRRYRDKLYLLAEVPDVDALEPGKLTADGDWLDLGVGSGQMRLEAGVDGGIDCDAVEGGLALRFRQGGEEFCPVGRRRTHKLKKLLQEDGVVPWMRQRIPLLYSGASLVAVGDLWIAANASKTNGYGILWRNRPALH